MVLESFHHSNVVFLLTLIAFSLDEAVNITSESYDTYTLETAPTQ